MDEQLTLHPTHRTPTDPGLWTYEVVDDVFERRSGHRVSRCEACHAAREHTYYLGSYGEELCAACVATCPCCYQRPVVVSARRRYDDPSSPGLVEHVCLECLEALWAPGDTLRATGEEVSHAA